MREVLERMILNTSSSRQGSRLLVDMRITLRRKDLVILSLMLRIDIVMDMWVGQMAGLLLLRNMMNMSLRNLVGMHILIITLLIFIGSILMGRLVIEFTLNIRVWWRNFESSKN
jgi:hypothetical protein